MTPAEQLREAALTIRAIAAHATPGPWSVPYEPRKPGDLPVQSVCVESPDLDHPYVALTGRWGSQFPTFAQSVADAAHIALWQPSTALLIAEILDVVARSANFTAGPDGGQPPMTAAALGLARAINEAM